MPAIWYVVEAIVNCRDISFGKVSVVHIAFAVDIQATWSDPRSLCALGMPFRMLCICNLYR